MWACRRTLGTYPASSRQREAWPYCVHGVVAASVAWAILACDPAMSLLQCVALGLCLYALSAEFLSVGFSGFLGPPSLLLAQLSACGVACGVMSIWLARGLEG